jgi:hypothetical protein
MALDLIGKTRMAALAAMALAAAACSRADDPTALTAKATPAPAARPIETVHAEFAAFEESGADLADIMAAIHAAEPEVYDKLVEIASSPSWTGRPVDALMVGRPLYLSAYRGKLPYASDKDVDDLIDILIDTHKALLPTAPLLCAKGEKAELAEVGKYVPAELLARENRLQARIIRITDQSASRATQPEIEEWKAKTFKGDEPRLKGNIYFELTDPTPEQASKICDSEMFILEKIRREKAERRAYLYRGLMSPR